MLLMGFNVPYQTQTNQVQQQAEAFRDLAEAIERGEIAHHNVEVVLDAACTGQNNFLLYRDKVLDGGPSQASPWTIEVYAMLASAELAIVSMRKIIDGLVNGEDEPQTVNGAKDESRRAANVLPLRKPH
jgi:hypothetical protein